MLWLSIHFFQLPLDIFCLDENNNSNTSLSNSYELAIEDNGKLAYCNSLAVLKGIEPGMKISTAYALSSSIHIKTRDTRLEKTVLTQLATLLYEFSSQVCLYDSKTILLEVGASCRLFSGLAELLKKLSLRLTLFSVQLQCALAITAKSAYLISVSESNRLQSFIELAERTSERATTGRAITERAITERSITSLAKIPIHYLLYEPSIDAKKLVTTSKRMGVSSIGQLIKLPYSAIGRRFGKAVLSYLYRLNGSIKDPQKLFELPEFFIAQRNFINGLDTVEQMLFPIKAMLAQLESFISVRRVMVTKLLFRLSDFSKVEQQVLLSFSSETQTLGHFLSMVRFQLERLEIEGKVETIILQANEFMALSEKQAQIRFSDPEGLSDFENKSDLMAVLFDQLRARLGKSACSQITINDEHLPEKSSRQRLTNTLKKPLKDMPKKMHKETRKDTRKETLKVMPNKSASKNEEPDCDKKPDCEEKQALPLWLLAVPEVISHQSHAEKNRLNYKGPLSRVSLAERMETNWWCCPQSRDYYQAESLQGVHYWIYFDRLKQQWLIHGVF